MEDGFTDIFLKGDRPGTCCEDMMIPWRLKTVVYSWNGSSFSESHVSFEKGQYRFQVVQDADREIRYGNFDIALAYYQEVIFSDKLEWWSKERREYEVKRLYDSYKQVTPTPLPYPLEDSTEYPRLAAYAYYRMVALHIYLGQMDAAQTKVDTMQAKFPQGNPGYPYVEMATAFSEAYQSTQDMTSACAAAIDYAAKHPDILVPLDSDYHGAQAKKYEPADVCPFR